jgi:hypothetical protein
MRFFIDRSVLVCHMVFSPREQSEGYIVMEAPPSQGMQNHYSSSTSLSNAERKKSLASLGMPTDAVDFPLGPPDDSPMVYQRHQFRERKRSVC